MRSKLREPFGKAGLTVAILALVLAMVGGAWAAAGLNGKQKKEVKNIAKSFQGTGPAGAAGSAGAKGDTGAKGDKGDKGDKGETGGAGKNGESVKLAAATGCGEVGGTKLSVGATSKEVCNGSPWTAGGTLPSGQTETGAWGTLNDRPNPGSISSVYISFPIPLEEGGEAILLNKEETENSSTNPDGCTGTVEKPTAPAGKLCIYTQEEGHENTFPGEIRYDGVEEEYLPVGTQVGFFASDEEVTHILFVNGSWAVTAP